MLAVHDEGKISRVVGIRSVPLARRHKDRALEWDAWLFDLRGHEAINKQQHKLIGRKVRQKAYQSDHFSLISLGQTPYESAINFSFIISL